MTTATTPTTDIGTDQVQAKPAVSRSGRGRPIVGVPLLLAAPAYATYLTGQDMADRVDLSGLPNQLLWAPVVAAAFASAAMTAAGVARFREYLRYRHNEIVAETDLDPQARKLLERVRAVRGEEVA